MIGCWMTIFLKLSFIGLVFILWRVSADELILTHIVYRHGDRSPIMSYPNDPYGISIWPQGFGQLTNVGKMQQYKLGQYLKSRYVDGYPYRYLNSSYDRLKIKIRSTDVDRTLMSAYSNLAGLFPPSNDQIWYDQLLWQPVPVHTVENSVDYLLNMEVNCSQYEMVYEKVVHGEEVAGIMEKHKNFFLHVKEKSGKLDLNLMNLWEIYDTLHCQYLHNFTLPSWAFDIIDGDQVITTMSLLYGTSFGLQYNRDTEAKFRGGPLLEKLLNDTMNKIKGTKEDKDVKIFMYSAHDDTLAALMSALNIFNELAPPYAACLLVEVFNNNNNNNNYYNGDPFRNLYVKISYRNDSNMEPYVLALPGCPANCPLPLFIELTKNNILEDWQAECSTNIKPPSSRDMILIDLVIVLIFIFVVIVIAVCVKVTKVKKRPGFAMLTDFE